MKLKGNWQQTVNGVFILDKPVGLSSNQALQKIRRVFRAKKAGHTGSLDVLASGLLPICFGEATKFSQYLLDADKIYYTVAQLGKRTTTCDAEGEITQEKTTEHIDLALIEATLKNFTGEIEQTPSMYSALKYNGQPLYKLARKGIEVERKKRKITIYSIERLNFYDDLLELKIRCSKGTYIRNLVDDIGQALNCGAYVKELRRLASGPFQQDQMHTLEELTDTKTQLQMYLLPIDSLLTALPVLQLSTEEIIRLQQGQRILLRQVSSASSSCTLERKPQDNDEQSLQDGDGKVQNLFRAYNEKQQLIGLIECLSDGVLKPKRLISIQP